MGTENIKEKVRKLLTMVERGSEYEAKVAMAKAQRLMMEHKISMAELQDQPEHKVIHRVTELYFTEYKNGYRSYLAQYLADLYCCSTCNTRYGQSSKTYIRLIGYQEDVEILEDILIYADACINDWYREFRKKQKGKKSNRLLNAWKNKYGQGFALGIRALLEQQMMEMQQEWGLVLVVPQEAKDFVENLTEAKYSFNLSRSHSVYDEGYNDGLHAEIQNKVTG